MKSTGPSSATREDAPLEEGLWLGALLGRIEGVRGDDVRVIVEGEDLRWEVQAPSGSFALKGLEPGPYRVEMRTERLVIAKRIDIVPGHNAVTLRVQPDVARRIGGAVVGSALAPVIRLPV